MYDTLIMLKPDAVFTVDDLYGVVTGVAASGEGEIARSGNTIRLTAGDASIVMHWNNAAYVVIESNEIAEYYAVASQGCRERVEMKGHDPDMELFNDYLLINERLQKTGKFVIFDPQECRLMFE